MTKLTATILVLTGAASFGILSTVVELAYQHGFTTAQVTGSQTLLGCILLWLMNIPSLKHTTRLPLKKTIALMLSGFFNGATGILYYQSLQTIPTAFAVILLFQFTWMGMLVDWIIQRRAPGRNQWIAVVIVLTGTFSSAGLDTSVLAHINPLGILLGLLAAASYTGFINVNGRVGLDVPPAQKSAWMMTGATLLTLIVFPPHFLFDGSITHGLWIWAALLGIFGVIIPPYLYARGIPFVGTSMATILGSIELPVVVILSSLVLREPVSWTQWLGTILILAGIVVSEYRRLLPVKQNTQQPSATSTNPLNSANDCTSPSQHQGPALHQ